METNGNSDIDVTLIDTHTDEVDRLSGVQEYFFTFLEKVVFCCEPKPYWNDSSCQDTEKSAITHIAESAATTDIPTPSTIISSSIEPSWNPIYCPTEYYTVKVKAEIIGDGESFEQIAQMEATCNVCYHFIQEDVSVLKTKCKCKLSLVHEKCYTEFPAKKQNEDKCDVCSEIIEYIPVTLSKPDDKPVDLIIDTDTGMTFTIQPEDMEKYAITRTVESTAIYAQISQPETSWNPIFRPVTKEVPATIQIVESAHITQDSAPQPSWNPICRQVEVFIVKVKAEINGDGESFETIAEMEATCDMCSVLLQEEISVLKIKCRCKLSLLHETCYNKLPADKQNNDKCKVCKKIIKYIPATLSRSAQLPESSKSFNKWISKLFGHRSR